MNNISDQELLMLLREKNEDAEELLYNKYFKIIKRKIYNYKTILNSLNIDSEEVFNDCVDSLNYAIETYSNLNTASFYTYLNLLVQRKIIKIIIKNTRRNKYINYISLDILNDNNKEIPDNKNKDILSKLCNEENIQQINEIILKTLSTNELTSFVMLLQGYTYNEIAKILNKSYNQIYYEINTTKKKIIKQIKKNNAKLLAFSGAV